MSFQTFGLLPELLRGVAAQGYTDPTPIQQDAIPPGLAGKDLLACAATGSGKTAAFALPILQRLLPKKRGLTRCLVLAPTRELAAQIQEQFALLGAHTPVRAEAVFGGVGMGPQEAAFRRGVDVIVATPGRLLDHLQYPYARLDNIEILVLDEADRMLDMGFLPDIKRILGRLPRGPRQTMLFSATMPGPIVTLSKDLLRDPATINLERKAAPPSAISQAVYPVSEDRKVALLLEILRRPEVKSVLTFTRTKHRANRLAEQLEKHGVPCARIHGNRSQAQRTLALDGFKNGEHRVLVATDIAARGIDIDELSHVVNFDVPGLSEDYIHRVGRTGRAEATGSAFTFVSPDEEAELRAIERALGKKLERLTIPGFDYHARATERFEIPIGERIAQIRARKAEDRKRAAEKAARKTARAAGLPMPPQSAQKPPARSQGPSRPFSGGRQGGGHQGGRDGGSSRSGERPVSQAPHGLRPIGQGARHEERPSERKRESGRHTFAPDRPASHQGGQGGHTPKAGPAEPKPNPLPEMRPAGGETDGPMRWPGRLGGRRGR